MRRIEYMYANVLLSVKSKCFSFSLLVAIDFHMCHVFRKHSALVIIILVYIYFVSYWILGSVVHEILRSFKMCHTVFVQLLFLLFSSERSSRNRQVPSKWFYCRIIRDLGEMNTSITFIYILIVLSKQRLKKYININFDTYTFKSDKQHTLFKHSGSIPRNACVACET